MAPLDSLRESRYALTFGLTILKFSFFNTIQLFYNIINWKILPHQIRFLRDSTCYHKTLSFLEILYSKPIVIVLGGSTSSRNLLDSIIVQNIPKLDIRMERLEVSELCDNIGSHSFSESIIIISISNYSEIHNHVEGYLKALEKRPIIIIDMIDHEFINHINILYLNLLYFTYTISEKFVIVLHYS